MPKTRRYQWDVFVSHNREQKPWVRAIVKQWRSMNVRVFFDEDSIEPGEQIVTGIERGLEGSRHVIFVITPAAVANRWVAMETASAIFTDADGQQRRLIPVLLEPTPPETIRLAVRTIFSIDLTNPATRTDRYHYLLEFLNVKERPPCPSVSGEPDGDSTPNQATLSEPQTGTGAPREATQMLSGPIRVFYSYSHKDGALRDKLEEALALLKRQGLIAEWHDRRIGAGEEWKGAIDKNLQEAHVILLLISASFINSDYCWGIEVTRAMERHDLGEAKVIPVIVRECDWQGAPFGKLQGLPRDTKAVMSWSNKDEAWTDVALGVRQAIDVIRIRSASPLADDRVKAGTGELDRSVSAVGLLDGPGDDVRYAIRERIERRLKRLGQPEVTKFPVLRDLEKELRSEDDDSEFPESADPIPVILDALLDQRSLGNISGLSEIYDQRCKATDWNAAEIVAEIIDEVAPRVVNPALANRIWAEIKVRKTALYFMPVDQCAGAEVLMACADGKSMKVKPPTEIPPTDFYGTPLLQGGGYAFGKPVTIESLAESVLLDLCTGQGLSDSSKQKQTLDVLAEQFAGILIDNSRGVNKGRTLYGLHKMPENPHAHAVHIDALTLIRDKLAEIKQKKPIEFKGLPGFVFLVLARESDHQGLETVVIQVLKRRFEREKNRTVHVDSN